MFLWTQLNALERLFKSELVHVITNLSKPIEWTPPRENPHENYGLGVIMTWQCDSFIVTNVPLWWRDVENGKAMHVRVCRVYEKSLYSLLMLWIYKWSKK